MIDLSDAVQSAVFDALSAGVTGAPIHSVVPQTTPPPAAPYVVLADDAVTDESVKTRRLERHDVTVRVVAAAGSKRPMFELMRQVRQSLENQVLAFAGAALSKPQWLSADDFVEAATQLQIGEQRFSIFAQPAD